MAHLPQGDRVEIVLDRYLLFVSSGVIERDWFLSTVFCVSNAGVAMPLTLQSSAPCGRLVVLGTNGAFLEVIGGELEISLLSDPAVP